MDDFWASAQGALIACYAICPTPPFSFADPDRRSQPCDRAVLRVATTIYNMPISVTILGIEHDDSSLYSDAIIFSRLAGGLKLVRLDKLVRQDKRHSSGTDAISQFVQRSQGTLTALDSV